MDARRAGCVCGSQSQNGLTHVCVFSNINLNEQEWPMNVQERDQLLKFLATLRYTPVKLKDPLADSILPDTFDL